MVHLMKTKAERELFLCQKKRTVVVKHTEISTYNLGDSINAINFTQCWCTALGKFQLH